MTTYNWPLGNGSKLEFTIFRLNVQWNAIGGLYIFTYPLENGHWFPLYVGQTDDFSTRIPSHERLEDAVQHGATNIHAVVVQTQQDRDRWERMLIQYLQPPMNNQLR